MTWKDEKERNSQHETNQSKGISWPERSSWSPSPEAAAPLFERSSWSPPTHSSRPCHSWSWLHCLTPSMQDRGKGEDSQLYSLDRDSHHVLRECGYSRFLMYCAETYHNKRNIVNECFMWPGLLYFFQIIFKLPVKLDFWVILLSSREFERFSKYDTFISECF